LAFPVAFDVVLSPCATNMLYDPKLVDTIRTLTYSLSNGDVDAIINLSTNQRKWLAMSRGQNDRVKRWGREPCCQAKYNTVVDFELLPIRGELLMMMNWLLSSAGVPKIRPVSWVDFCSSWKNNVNRIATHAFECYSETSCVEELMTGAVLEKFVRWCAGREVICPLYMSSGNEMEALQVAKDCLLMLCEMRLHMMLYESTDEDSHCESVGAFQESELNEDLWEIVAVWNKMVSRMHVVQIVAFSRASHQTQLHLPKQMYIQTKKLNEYDMRECSFQPKISPLANILCSQPVIDRIRKANPFAYRLRLEMKISDSDTDDQVTCSSAPSV